MTIPIAGRHRAPPSPPRAPSPAALPIGLRNAARLRFAVAPRSPARCTATDPRARADAERLGCWPRAKFRRARTPCRGAPGAIASRTSPTSPTIPSRPVVAAPMPLARRTIQPRPRMIALIAIAAPAIMPRLTVEVGLRGVDQKQRADHERDHSADAEHAVAGDEGFGDQHPDAEQHQQQGRSD